MGCLVDDFLAREITKALHINVPEEYQRVLGAAQAVRSDFAHLMQWDDGGRNWVRSEATKGNVGGLVQGLCEHHRREGKREEFKDLTDREIEQVQAECMKDRTLASEIMKALGIAVP